MNKEKIILILISSIFILTACNSNENITNSTPINELNLAQTEENDDKKEIEDFDDKEETEELDNKKETEDRNDKEETEGLDDKKEAEDRNDKEETEEEIADDNEKNQNFRDEDRSQFSHLEEYSQLNSTLNLEDLHLELVTDRQAKRIILLRDEEGRVNFKSIYIKRKNFLKVINVKNNELVYKGILS